MERRDLAPARAGGAAKLTVSVWLAERPQVATTASHEVEARKLERIS